MNNNPNVTANTFSAVDPVSNRTVYARISPCSWMHDDYGTQIGFGLTENANNSETIFINDKSVPYASANDEYIMERLHNFIQANGVVRLDEACAVWAAKKAQYGLEATLRKEAQDAEIAKQDAIHKAKGFTHRIEAWIHVSGDDKHIGFYMMNPTEAAIKKVLKQQGCQTQNDFKSVPL